MDSPEKGIRIATNGPSGARRFSKEFLQDVTAAAVHGVNNDLQLGCLNSVPIDKRLEMIEIELLRTDYFGGRGVRCTMERGPCSMVHCLQLRQVCFDLCRNRWRRAPTKISLHFEAVKGGWIVTRGDHDSAGKLTAPDLE